MEFFVEVFSKIGLDLDVMYGNLLVWGVGERLLYFITLIYLTYVGVFYVFKLRDFCIL